MSLSASVEEEEQVDLLFDYVQEEEEESVEDPEAEWSSVLCYAEGPEYTQKQKLYDEGLYKPPSKELCTKYVTMSTSSVLRHPYYKYPRVPDPGIEDALFKQPEQTEYPDDGLKMYLETCEKMGECPVRLFYNNLHKDEIDLKYYCISRYGFQPMAIALKHNPYVKKLDLSENFISIDGCFHLGEMFVTNRSIREISLNGCRMGPEGCRTFVDKLCFNSTLKKINFSRNNLTDMGMIYIANLISSGTCVEDFNFSHNELTSNAATHLEEAFENNNAVRSLDLSWNSFQVPKPVERMCKLLILNTNLVEINFAWNSLTDRHSKIIELIMMIPNLEAFYLNNNRLSGTVIPVIIAGISTAKNLKTLDLSFNPLSPEEALLCLMKMRRKSCKLTNLLLDGIVVTLPFVHIKNKILNLSFRKDATVIHGYVRPPMKVKERDMREIVLNRAQFLCSKPPKKALHVGTMVLKLQKLVNNKPIPAEQLPELIHLLGATQMNRDLMEQLGEVFQSPPPKSSRKKFVNISAMAEYVKIKWPDSEPPPPTPPPPPPPPPPDTPPSPSSPSPKPKKKEKKKK